MRNAIDFIEKDKNWQKEELSCFKTITELRQQYSKSDKAVLVKDYGAGSSKASRTKEEMEKGVESQKQISEIYKITSSPEKYGQLIFKIIREVQPQKVLELGTSLGISAAYQICALKLNNQGKFISIEGSPEIAGTASQTLMQLEYENFNIKTGKFKDVLPEILPGEKNIDMVFIDGHHDRDATKEYFETLFPYLSENSIIIFDDINWSDGMKQVWKEIYEDKRVNISFDLNKWGICQIDKRKTHGKTKYFKLNLN